MSKSVTVKIDVLGRPTIEAVGFSGYGCKQATQHLVDALSHRGEGIVEVEKPELHYAEEEPQEMHLGM